MTTNIMALPLISMEVDTGTNEDWLDTLSYVIEETGAQLDLRGIKFSMEIRTRPDGHEVMILATTEDGGLRIGEYPNHGWLIFYIPVDTMKEKWPGEYVGDVVATDGEITRRCITFNLSIIEGITR